jgi:hypothetical protein
MIPAIDFTLIKMYFNNNYVATYKRFHDIPSTEIDRERQLFLV